MIVLKIIIKKIKYVNHVKIIVRLVLMRIIVKNVKMIINYLKINVSKIAQKLPFHLIIYDVL